MSKKAKECLRFLNAKTLSSDEGCRFPILSKWCRLFEFLLVAKNLAQAIR